MILLKIDHIFMLLCISGNLWLNVTHCEFYLNGLFCFLLSIPELSSHTLKVAYVTWKWLVFSVLALLLARCVWNPVRFSLMVKARPFKVFAPHL